MKKNFMQNFYEIKEHLARIKTQYIIDKTDFAFQIEIIGEGSGIFYIEYKNDKLAIEPYNYYDYSAHIQASANIIIELALGKITINDAIRFGDINIISRTSDDLKKVISFFDTYYNLHNGNLYPEQLNQPVLYSTNPWDNLRLYIEQSNIDNVSKNQLLANLVKFTSKELHILIVGACGCGKSSTINALFNMEIAQVGYGVDPETQEVSVYKLDNLYLHDSPGLGESTVKDRLHINKIKRALQERDADGNAVIDVVLVIIDGSHRDMKSSFELINDVVIPNLQSKDRIIVGINRCDLALNGQGWIQKNNYPNEELLQRLKEKSESVRKRIKNDTGVDVEPVFYSALYKYNISKLLSYIVKSAPTRKRVFFAEKINNNPDNFLRDDTVTLKKKDNKQNYNTSRLSSSGINNTYLEKDELYKEVTKIKTSISGIEKKIDSMHTDLRKSDVNLNNSKEYGSQKQNTKKQESQIAHSNTRAEVNNDTKTEYELIKTTESQYKKDFQSSMEEAFEAASAEISKGSKEKIKFSFINVLDNMKQGAKAGAELGKEVGKNIPFIGVTIGGAVGAVIGGVGGFFSSVLKKKK